MGFLIYYIRKKQSSVFISSPCALCVLCLLSKQKNMIKDLIKESSKLK